MDFENLVPENVYAAAQKILNGGADKMNADSFQQRLQAKKPKSSWMFSKRVERWLDDQFDLPLYKPAVMEKAVMDVPVASINVAPLHTLLSEMRKLLK